MKKFSYLKSVLLVGIILLVSSCITELEKYYQTPDWLKGNAWEVLEDKGNFKLFLAAVERTSYKDLVQGKGIITVMAPTDSAFQVYLSAHNYASVEAIPVDVLDKLIGYHLVYYAYNKSQFEDYKPFGTESENAVKGGYYKFRTKSRDSISNEYDPAYNVARKVMHLERFLPIFSNNFFESYQMNAKENYEFFYPNSTWTGADGFNVSNASVKEYGIVTDNGYVYVVNQVLEPLETIYKSLAKNPDFSLFRESYQRFVSFLYDSEASASYGKTSTDSIYYMYHASLPSIDQEWPVTDYMQLSTLSFVGINVFAPNNASMQAFFDKYWKPYYTNLREVNFEPLLALLQNHYYASTMLFPQKIESGLLKSADGSPLQFNRTDVTYKAICVNGSLYGLNHLFVPPVFEKVTSPMYCDPQYNIFLDMTKYSGYMGTLISDATHFSLFYPNDNMITVNTNLEGRGIQYQNTNAKKYGAQEVQIDGDLGFAAMSASMKKSFAGAHIATEKISTKGTQSIYRTLLPFNYLYVNDDKIYSSSLYNLGVAAKVPTFSKINGDWTNGDAYALQGETASALVPESNQFKAMFPSSASQAEFQYFKELVVTSAAMDKTSPPFNFLQGDRFVVFIPSNTVILNNFAKIPYANKDQLTEYLKRYFVNVNVSGLLDYPFSGSGINAEVSTFAKTSTGAAVKFTVIDKAGQLYVRDGKGNEVKVLSYFPYIYADGAAYLIDGLLELQ